MNIAEFIRDNVDQWNKRDKESFLADFDANCEILLPGGMLLRGRDGAELFWHGYQDAFPDNHISLHAAFGAADNGTEEASFEGTQTGILLGADGRQIPPTGRTVKISYAAVYTYRAEHIAAVHLYFDQVDLLSQLGAL